MASTAEPVRVHYHRPPDRDEIFVQELVTRTGECIVTFMERTPLERPVTVGRRTILDDGSPAVWFTFPGLWHDVGLFHTADGRFTGTYANVLTPVRLTDATTWHTTDLFLDVWMDPDGAVRLLDEEELDTALRNGWIDADLGRLARAEADRLISSARCGDWPPAIVREWPLERVLHEIGSR